MRSILYKTKSGNVYPLDIDYKIIEHSDIIFEPIRIEELCKKGCSNYNRSGGCPPSAPKFDKLVKSNHKFILVITKFDSKYKTDKVKACKNRAIHWKFQDAILARFCDGLGRTLSVFSGCFFLGTGYCMGCPGKKCSLKLGNRCRHPERRTYSMEATGINVVKTVNDVFNIDFYWYTKHNLDIPYMMKSILLVLDENAMADVINEMERMISVRQI